MLCFEFRAGREHSLTSFGCQCLSGSLDSAYIIMEPQATDALSVSKNSEDQPSFLSPSPDEEGAGTTTSSVYNQQATTENSEVGEGDNGAEAPPVSDSPLPDPKRVSLLKCCEWLESKLDFKTLNDVGENSDIRSAFIEFITDQSIEAMFLYEDRSTGIVSVRFSAMEVPPEGQVRF
jgi:hypothetical protein